MIAALLTLYCYFFFTLNNVYELLQFYGKQKLVWLCYLIVYMSSLLVLQMATCYLLLEITRFNTVQM